MRFLFLSLLVLFPRTGFPFQSILNGSYRSYPLGANLEAQFRQDVLLWGQAGLGKWKFGYFQPKIAFAAQGLSEVGLAFYPISILELAASQSLTSRWASHKNMDCDNNLCSGNVQRSKVAARLALAYLDYRILLGRSQSWSVLQDKSKPYFDEIEYLYLSAGGDTLNSSHALFGVQKESGFYGLFARFAWGEHSKQENETEMLVYRQKEFGFAWNFGLGRYQSSLHRSQLTAVVVLSWSWGQGIGLL